ncbi:hypothetical protein AAMO2058_000249900 [Amorphochlora amoebiformis]
MVSSTAENQPVFPSGTYGNGIRVIGKSTKFIVAGCVGISFLTLRNALVLNMVVGALGNAIFNKGLKRVINEARPDGAKKPDPGMPSSHACSLAFLSSYCLLALFTYLPPWWPSIVPPPVLATVVLAYDYISLLYRYYSGLHTIPQLAVGSLVGVFNAVWWFILCYIKLTPEVDALLGEGGVPILYALGINAFGAIVLYRELRYKLMALLGLKS